MTLALNEVKQAECIISNGLIGNKVSSTLFLLGKYYCHEKEYNKNEIIQSLNNFMTKNCNNYNPVLWEDLIEDISNNASKYSLRQIDCIEITPSEFKQIRTLSNLKLEKLYFVLLCHAKLHNKLSPNNNGWTNITILDLFKEARVTVKFKNDKFLLINDLFQKGYISFSKKNENLNIKVNFEHFENNVDNIGDIDLPIKITDFRELGYQYLKYWNKNKFLNCDRCGIVVPKKTNNQQYCSDCAKIVNVEKQRERDKKKKS